MEKPHITAENIKITTIESKQKQWKTKMEKNQHYFSFWLIWKNRMWKKNKLQENKRNTYFWQCCARNIHEQVIKDVYLVFTAICWLYIKRLHHKMQFFIWLWLQFAKKSGFLFTSKCCWIVHVNQDCFQSGKILKLL